MIPEATKKRPRGFAAMSPEKQKAIASKGGKAAHAKGRGHEWTSETARAAGARGGEVSARNYRARTSSAPDVVEAVGVWTGEGSGEAPRTALANDQGSEQATTRSSR